MVQLVQVTETNASFFLLLHASRLDQRKNITNYIATPSVFPFWLSVTKRPNHGFPVGMQELFNLKKRKVCFLQKFFCQLFLFFLLSWGLLKDNRHSNYKKIKILWPDLTNWYCLVYPSMLHFIIFWYLSINTCQIYLETDIGAFYAFLTISMLFK